MGRYAGRGRLPARHRGHCGAGPLNGRRIERTAIFSMLPACAVDQRLTLAGYRPAVLIAGRLIVLETAALGISLLTATVMIAGTGPAHPAAVVAGVILTGLVAVPLGLALGTLLPRELEAVLILIVIVGIQITAGPDTIIAAVLPFHAARQLLDAATPPPRPVIAAYMPSARVRSFPSGKVTAISGRPAGAASAAPTPCSTRAMISSHELVAKPPSSEARVKNNMPALNMRRHLTDRTRRLGDTG